MIEEYKLKNGESRFEVYAYLGNNYYTGKNDRVRKKGFLTHEEAELFLAKAIVEYHEKGVLAREPKMKSFGEVYELWFKQYKHNVQGNTYIKTLEVANIHILPIFKDSLINRISVEFCQDIVNEWYKSYAKASMLVSIVKRIFKLGINLNYCSDNPMSKVMRPKKSHETNYMPPFYTKAELNRFFECIQQTESKLVNVLFRVLAYCGLRRSEIMALQWRDIDEVNRIMSINRVLAESEEGTVIQPPKNFTSQRKISIDATTMKILHEWRTYQKRHMLKLGFNTDSPEQFIFNNQETNSHLNLYYLGNKIPKILKKHNLPRINTHGFRHTHCSLLFEAGLDMQEVKDRLGHSKISTTMNIYAHVTANRRDEAADKFEKFLAL